MVRKHLVLDYEYSISIEANPELYYIMRMERGDLLVALFKYRRNNKGKLFRKTYLRVAELI
ncbi:MAG: hypothetical protein A2X45_25030 [Lentisphaerae bacterium GWF2_50_93]|nr:MAG: hypothetical protein A2X45_25030 [Lentisphaerae bacterium GWF2_50_93]